MLVIGKKRLGVGCLGPKSVAEIALEIVVMLSGQVAQENWAQPK